MLKNAVPQSLQEIDEELIKLIWVLDQGLESFKSRMETDSYFDIVKILVEAGANIHENSGMGTTAITFASMFGHTKIVEYLNKQNKNRSFKSTIYLLLSKFISLFKKNK